MPAPQRLLGLLRSTGPAAPSPPRHRRLSSVRDCSRLIALAVIVVDTPHRRHCNTSVSSSGSRPRTARSCILSSQTGQAPSLEHALAKVDEAATAAADDL